MVCSRGWGAVKCRAFLPDPTVGSAAVSQEKSEAVVVRGVDFSETSRIVTFLTPDRGRLTCLARGVRRKKSPFAGALDTLNRVELVYYWKEGREVQNLAEATVLESFQGIRRDAERAAYAAFSVEAAIKTTESNAPSEELYAALVNGLRQMDSWTGSLCTHAAWHGLQILATAGFAPELDACMDSEELPGPTPWFSLTGGLTHRPERGDRRLTPEMLAAMRAMMASPDICPVRENLPEVFRLVGRYAAHQLESEFRTLRVIEDMFN